MTDNKLTSQVKELLLQAQNAAQRAYVPYSHFKVGAALLLSDGTVSLGCNVENASYGATMCAERVAVFAACALLAGFGGICRTDSVYLGGRSRR